MPNFKADKLEAMAWNWLKGILADPERLEKDLHKYNQDQESTLKPIRERLTVVKSLLDSNQAKRKRWLEMCADGLITKDEAKEHTQTLNKTIADLREQQDGLRAKLKMGKFSEQEITTLLEMSRRLAQKLESMEDDFKEKRWYIERLDFKTILMIKDDRKKVKFSCCLGEEVLPFETNTTIRVG